MPDQRIEADWPFPHRLPLGAAWSGACTAGEQSTRCGEPELKACNVGYAHGCHKLPGNRSADAVRFALGDERDGLIRIRFACEREYLPVAHGELVYEMASRQWPAPHSDACLQQMAECYLQTQLARRK
jgi:hypothetical protein